MSKTRVFSRLVSKIRESKLADAAQPLKFRRIDESDDQPALVGAGMTRMMLL